MPALVVLAHNSCSPPPPPPSSTTTSPPSSPPCCTSVLSAFQLVEASLSKSRMRGQAPARSAGELCPREAMSTCCKTMYSGLNLDFRKATREPHPADQISSLPHILQPPLQSRASSLGCTDALQQNVTWRQKKITRP